MGLADGLNDVADLIDRQRLDGDFLGVLGAQ